MRLLALLIFLAVASPAVAQQELGSPSALALQINGAVAQIAQRAEHAERQVQQLAAEVKRLKDKYEPGPVPAQEQKKD